jgi:hypothetical protein
MPDDGDDIDSSAFSVLNVISLLLHKEEEKNLDVEEQIGMALTSMTAAGRLPTTKVGLDDIVTTYDAAKSVYGWTVLNSSCQKFQVYSSANFKSLKLAAIKTTPS